MRLAIEHATTYHYDQRVLSSTQLLRLTPHANARQRVLSWQLDLPCAASRTSDPFGNVQHVLTLDTPHQDIELVARGIVELDMSAATDDEERLNPLVFTRTTALTRPDTALDDFAENFRATNPSREQLRALAIAIADRVAYTQGTTHAGTTAAEAFAQRSGVCQDHTHIFLACARLVGVPARYVSGYVHSEARSHVASHAWAEAWVGGHWLTFDISNRLDRLTTHIRLAIGLDYLDACPVRGIRYGGGSERLTAQAVIEMAQQPNQ